MFRTLLVASMVLASLGPLASATHICSDYDNYDWPYTQVSCSFSCDSGTYVSVWIVSDDDDADVYGEATCGGIRASCSGEGYECSYQNPDPVPESLVVYQGACSGFANEVWPSGLFIQCAAGEQWGSRPGMAAHEWVSVELIGGEVSAEACSMNALQSECFPIPAQCWLATRGSTAGMLCGTLPVDH